MLAGCTNIKYVTYKGIYLTEYREFVVWQETIGFVQQEISPNELLKTPIFTLDEPVSTLALWKHNIVTVSRSSIIVRVYISDIYANIFLVKAFQSKKFASSMGHHSSRVIKPFGEKKPLTEFTTFKDYFIICNGDDFSLLTMQICIYT